MLAGVNDDDCRDARSHSFAQRCYDSGHPGNLISRARLMEQLECGLTHKLTLGSAQAGAGKALPTALSFLIWEQT